MYRPILLACLLLSATACESSQPSSAESADTIAFPVDCDTADPCSCYTWIEVSRYEPDSERPCGNNPGNNSMDCDGAQGFDSFCEIISGGAIYTEYLDTVCAEHLGVANTIIKAPNDAGMTFHTVLRCY